MTRRLLLLNGLAVVGAVVNHASGWGFTAMFFWTDRYAPVGVPDFSQLGSPAYYALRCLQQLIMFSLPAFLFVSGYFVAFAAGRERVFGWAKVRSRLRMLLIPYVIWSVVIFVGRGAEGMVDTPAGYLEQLTFGRAAEPYYYVIVMTQLFLLAPLLVTLVSAHWKPALLAAAVVQLGVQAARYPVLLGAKAPLAAWIDHHNPGWFFPHMVFWFVFGIVAGFHLEELMRWVGRWRSLLPWLTLGLGALAVAEWELLVEASGSAWLAPRPTALDSLYSMACILTFLAFARDLPASQPLETLGTRSFGVYLIHAPVLELLSRATYHLVPSLLAYQLLFFSVLVVTGVAVPLLLMAIVNRSPARPQYNYLFG